MDKPTVCIVEGCERPRDSKGWCRLHYARVWATGEPGPVDPIKVFLGPGPCAAEGCDRERRTKGYCDLHYRRLRRRGLSPDSLTFKRMPKPRSRDSYGAVHERLRVTFGPARKYRCIECGEAAAQWAYQHNDPNELTNPAGMPYSTNIDECYEPMCLSCHNRFDADLDERVARHAAITD